MKIKNFNLLATTVEREVVLKIAEAGLEAIDTRLAIQKNISEDGGGFTIAGKHYSIDEVGRLHIVGIGKCAIDAVEAIDEILHKHITTAIAYDVRLPENPKDGISYYRGTHPFPTQENVDSAKQVAEVLVNLNERDLVLFVISGGGSTLLCQPQDGKTWEDESKILKELFKSGATIQEINIERKKLSPLRAGGLARMSAPAKVVSLIFSDVVGNDLSVICSGPTILDTPEDRVRNQLVVSNETALAAMKEKAEELGVMADIVTSSADGLANEFAKDIVNNLHNSESGRVYLYGGETTVKATSGGKGGRNQEVALAVLENIKDGEIVLTLASDGRDNGDYAGALVENQPFDRSYLDQNNSEMFFEKFGGHVVTGPTGSNVADLTIAYKFQF